jgi:hypothetical protein
MSAGHHHDSERPNLRSTLTGARNDNSSLFSLDLIRRAEAAAARMPKDPDDEAGVIDLGALVDLARSAPSRADRAPLIISASASLFATSPVSVPPSVLAEVKRPVVSDPPPNFSPRRANLVLAMGAVAVFAVAAAAFVVMQGSAAPPVAAAPAVAMEAVPPAAVAPPPVVVAPAAALPPIAAMTPGQHVATVESPKPAVAAVKAASPRKSAGAGPKAEAREAAPKEESKPAAPVCDLACQMERAVAATK